MRISKAMRATVAFILYRNKYKNGSLSYAGTAFFTHDEVDKDVGLAYIVTITAKHVIQGIDEDSVDKKAILHLNKRNGESDYMETDTKDWKFHPESERPTDIAVLPSIPTSEFDWGSFPLAMRVTDDMLENDIVGLGDDVFVVGLFRGYLGKKKIQPIVRIGNIAMLPDEPIPTRLYGDIDAYLIESRSTRGLSGSPVFVHAPMARQIGINFQWKGPKFYFLGLIYGHYDLKFPKETGLVEDDTAQETVNRGISIVIPAKHILETIEHPEIVAMRAEERNKLLENMVPTEGT